MMKHRAALVALILAAAGASATVLARTHSPSDGATRVASASATVTIEIPEVSCAGCSLEARKAVKSVGGVVQLGEGDPQNRLVVAYEPAPGRPEAYVEALHKAGFAKAREVARG